MLPGKSCQKLLARNCSKGREGVFINFIIIILGTYWMKVLIQERGCSTESLWYFSLHLDAAIEFNSQAGI